LGEAGKLPLTKNRHRAQNCNPPASSRARGSSMAKKKRKKAKKKKAKKAKAAKKKKAKRKKGRRTTMYSSKGKKLYAVRSADGKFKDIQTYKRAHGMDIKRNSADGN
jgi:DNA-binding protein HU-beta